MRKYFNLALNIPPLILIGTVVYSNMSIAGVILALLAAAGMISATATSEKSPVQMLPVYIFCTYLGVISAWVPAAIANRNTALFSVQQLTERISTNANTELMPLIIAVALGVLLSVITKVTGKDELKSIGKIITLNAYCIAAAVILFSGTYLVKLSVIICVITVLYAALFSEDNRIDSSLLKLFIIGTNVYSLAFYITASDFVQFTLASKLPAIIASISSNSGRLWISGIAAYLLVSHIIVMKKSSDILNDSSVMQSTLTLLLLFAVYAVSKNLNTGKYFLWIAVSILLALNIFYRSFRSGSLLGGKEYIYTSICAAILLILTSIYLSRKALIITLFSGEVMFYTAAALLLASAITVHISAVISYPLLTASVLLSGAGYGIGAYGIILTASVGIVGFLIIFAKSPKKFCQSASVLALALVAGCIHTPHARVFIYRDAENICGDTSLANSLLCILAEDKYTDTESLSYSWDDGEGRDITGFKKAFTRVKSGRLTVTSRAYDGTEKKQVYDFAPVGEWQPPTGRYTPIDNGHNALKIVEFNKAALGENDLPIKRGRIIDDGNVYVTDKNVCISMANRKKARAIEYVIVDSENNVLSDGYVANTAYIEIAFPSIPAGSRLLAVAMDEEYNVTPVTEWGIIG